MPPDKLRLFATTSCQFNCKHCGRDLDAKDMDPALAESILEQARALGFNKVRFTGGETILHPELGRILDAVVENGFTFEIASNGWQHEDYARLLASRLEHMHGIYFSLDGADAATHDAVRRPGSFDQVLEAIKLFSGLGAHVTVGVTLNRLNHDQIEDAANLAFHTGAAHVRFNCATPTQRNMELILTDDERVHCWQRVEKLMEQDKPVSRSASLLVCPGVDFCDGANLGCMAVTPEGELLFCCDVVKEPVLGSLKETPLAMLMEQGIEVGAVLKKLRLRDLTEGRWFEGFSSCMFCARYLEGMADGRDQS